MFSTVYHIHDIVGRSSDISNDKLLAYSVKAGFKKLYFTEHYPLPLQYKDRPNLVRVREWKKELMDLVNNKYQGKIKVYFGTEMEYPRTNLSYFKNVVNSKIFDFVIFGNHFYTSNSYAIKSKAAWHEVISGHESSKKALITKNNLDIFYRDTVRAFKSKIFSEMAHPDIWLWKYNKWDKNAISLTKKIIALCEKYHMPVGFNSKRFNTKAPSKPIIKFWKMVSKSKVEVIIESDAHKFEHFTKDNLEHAYDVACELGLEKNIVENIKIKFFKK